MDQTEQKFRVSRRVPFDGKINKVYTGTGGALAHNFLKNGRILAAVFAQNVTNVTLLRLCNILAQMAHGVAIFLVCHFAVPA